MTLKEEAAELLCELRACDERYPDTPIADDKQVTEIEAFARRQRAQALRDAADALFAGTYKGELAVKVSTQLWLQARAASEGDHR